MKTRIMRIIRDVKENEETFILRLQITSLTMTSQHQYKECKIDGEIREAIFELY